MPQVGSDFGRALGLLTWVLDFLSCIDSKEHVSGERVALVVAVVEKAQVSLGRSWQPELVSNANQVAFARFLLQN